MIPHFCTTAHNPPFSYGDCLRAAIASVLETDQVTDVPHFMAKGDDQDGHDMLRSYLQSQGLVPYINGYPAQQHSYDDVQAMQAAVNPGVTYLLFGKSADINHVVVCRDGKIIHDPGGAITERLSAGHNHDGIPGGVWLVMVLVPISYRK